MSLTEKELYNKYKNLTIAIYSPTGTILSLGLELLSLFQNLSHIFYLSNGICAIVNNETIPTSLKIEIPRTLFHEKFDRFHLNDIHLSLADWIYISKIAKEAYNNGQTFIAYLLQSKLILDINIQDTVDIDKVLFTKSSTVFKNRSNSIELPNYIEHYFPTQLIKYQEFDYCSLLEITSINKLQPYIIRFAKALNGLRIKLSRRNYHIIDIQQRKSIDYFICSHPMTAQTIVYRTVYDENIFESPFQFKDYEIIYDSIKNN